MKHPFQLRSPLFSVSSFFRGHPLTTCLQLNIRKRMNRYPMCFVQYGNGPIKKRSEKKKPQRQKLCFLLYLYFGRTGMPAMQSLKNGISPAPSRI